MPIGGPASGCIFAFSWRFQLKQPAMHLPFPAAAVHTTCPEHRIEPCRPSHSQSHVSVLHHTPCITYRGGEAYERGR